MRTYKPSWVWKMIEYTKQKEEKPDPNADVRQLPNGAGWGLERLRNCQHVQALTVTLILVGHVKDKMIKKEEISEMQLDQGNSYCGEAMRSYLKGNSTFMSLRMG